MREDSGYENVTPEDLLDHEGIEYRATSGSRGPQFNVKECPSCGGSDWKVYLARDTGFGNCFHGSCQRSFNLWTFAKAHLGEPDSKTVGRLFDEIAKGGGWKPKFRAPKIVAPVFTGDFALPASIDIPANNLAYLADRGVTVELAREFGLRLCYAGAFDYQDEEGNPQKMRFAGRIIIPIYDLEGNLVTFQGRDITGTSNRKYLFPPRLPSTARYLYNGHRALAERWSHVVMGEGAFDVIAIQAAIDGDRSWLSMGAVGSFGKNLTLDADHNAQTQLQALLQLKSAGLRTVTILWDGEAGALKSAAAAAEKLSRHDLVIRIGFLPRGKDPAEVDAAVVRKAIERAIPYSRAVGMKIKLRNPYA